MASFYKLNLDVFIKLKCPNPYNAMSYIFFQTNLKAWDIKRVWDEWYFNRYLQNLYILYPLTKLGGYKHSTYLKHMKWKFNLDPTTKNLRLKKYITY